MEQLRHTLHDTHTHHAPFSFDARQDLAELLAAGAAHGLAGVMLTDHYDKDVQPPGQAEEIFDIEAARREWLETGLEAGARLGLDVRFGIEIGYQPHLLQLCRELAAPGRFDGIILSIHQVGVLDPFFDVDFYRDGKRATYARYLETLAEAADRIPGPGIAGHFDYVIRYAPFADVEFHYEELPEAFDNLFRVLIASGKCLEINVRSFQRRMRKLDDPEAERRALDSFPLDPVQLEPRFQIPGFQFPDPRIIRRYLELGGRHVSLASDAHKPGETGANFEIAAQYLQACGVTELTHFEGGLPVLVPITPGA